MKLVIAVALAATLSGVFTSRTQRIRLDALTRSPLESHAGCASMTPADSDWVLESAGHFLRSPLAPAAPFSLPSVNPTSLSYVADSTVCAKVDSSYVGWRIAKGDTSARSESVAVVRLGTSGFYFATAFDVTPFGSREYVVLNSSFTVLGNVLFDL